MSRELTPEQSIAVFAPGPVCLTASAGSGKTSVLVERYLHLLKQGLRPEQILTVTFTRKAAAQLRDRLLERLSEGPEATRQAVELTPWIGTLHSVCLQIVLQWGALLGKQRVGEMVDPFDQAGLVSRAVDDWLEALDPQTTQDLADRWMPQDLRAMAEEILARPHAFEAAWKRLAPDALLRRAFEPLNAKWASLLSASGLGTFDDLEHDAGRILTEFPEARENYRRHFRAILVDEFQDTSPSQWHLLEALTGDNWDKLFLVGDPKQSIYRFRNADVALFLKWSGEIEAKGGQAIELRTCFRASPELVATVNGVAEGLFAGSSLAEIPMLAAREACSTPPFTVHRYSGENAGRASECEREKTTQVVQGLLRKGVPPSEIALLFRNSDRMEGFASHLAAVSIPVSCESVVDLFSLYEVQDIAAYLRAIAFPLEDFHLAAFLRTPAALLSPVDLQALAGGRGASLLEKLLSSGKLPWFTALIESGVCETQALVEALFRNTALLPGRSLHTLLTGLAKCPRLEQAIAQLKTWEKEGIRTTTTLGSAPEGVRLLTVHAAKGLEFSQVLLVDGLRRAPTRLPWFNGENSVELGFRYREGGEILATPAYDELRERHQLEEKQEASRVLYVALTRAKDGLHFFFPENEKLIPQGSWVQVLKDWTLKN